jgi:hypothetical protein
MLEKTLHWVIKSYDYLLFVLFVQVLRHQLLSIHYSKSKSCFDINQYLWICFQQSKKFDLKKTEKNKIVCSKQMFALNGKINYTKQWPQMGLLCEWIIRKFEMNFDALNCFGPEFSILVLQWLQLYVLHRTPGHRQKRNHWYTALYRYC